MCSHKYNVQDEVTPKIWKDIRGRITLISISLKGVEYEVRYFDGVEMRCAWFFEDEIKRADKSGETANP